MQQATVFPLLAFVGCLGGSLGAHAQGTPPDGQVYQITSGSYQMVGGIWGVLTRALPGADQAYVCFKTNTDGVLADLSIVGEDQQSVFLALTNGVVSGSAIRFQYPVRHEYPEIETFGTLDYTVTNAAGGLRLDGSISFPFLGPDIPTYYAHTNVVAVAMPVLETRVSEVEIRWGSDADRVYQVQYRSALTTNVWTDLGAPVSGSSPVTSVFDKVPAGEPQRFYRVLVVP